MLFKIEGYEEERALERLGKEQGLSRLTLEKN